MGLPDAGKSNLFKASNRAGIRAESYPSGWTMNAFGIKRFRLFVTSSWQSQDKAPLT